MAHYARLDGSNVVIMVHPGKDESDTSQNWEDYYAAKRCSYNTHGGKHSGGGQPFRYNYPGPGYTFSDDPVWADQGGAFIPPQPFPSWTLDMQTALWVPPIPYPDDDGPYIWDETSQSWVEVQL